MREGLMFAPGYQADQAFAYGVQRAAPWVYCGGTGSDPAHVRVHRLYRRLVRGMVSPCSGRAYTEGESEALGAEGRKWALKLLEAYLD
jgi:hypothetical protein